MCDMQKMPTREDASCEEDSEMNFTTFSAVGGGAHFVTAGGQMPVAKIQQANGNPLPQMVSMVGSDGVQYVRALDGSMQPPQLISFPIALPGHKQGDPQPTVQIQVLNPGIIQQQQQPKYQMQIPIQGFSQGGAVLTLAYTQDGSENGGLQLVGQNTLAESGLQMVTSLPQEMHLVQPQTHTEDKIQTNLHQVFITPNQQIIINSPDTKPLNNNTTADNNNTTADDIVIKEESHDSLMDEESSQGTEGSEGASWTMSSDQENLAKYLNTLQPQQAQALPQSLQQFLKMNPVESGVRKFEIEVELESEVTTQEPVAEAVIREDGTVWIQSKKKKKYKKKPPKPVRPKPGQVVIATAADGTPIFCCPECQMAYPDKDELEGHLLLHKIERRFICGICGAGLKRKEHLERHKLGHNPERPFVCAVCKKGFKRREHLTLHTVMHSGVKTEVCNVCGKGFYRKDHLRKHTRSHENKRLRDSVNAGNNAEIAIACASPTPIANADAATVADDDVMPEVKQEPGVPSGADGTTTVTNNYSMLPEITIHVPTSANMQVPVQINIPKHVMSSLAAAQRQQLHQHQQNQQHQQQQQNQQPQVTETQTQFEALLAQQS